MVPDEKKNTVAYSNQSINTQEYSQCSQSDVLMLFFSDTALLNKYFFCRCNLQFDRKLSLAPGFVVPPNLDYKVNGGKSYLPNHDVPCCVADVSLHISDP